MACNATVFVMMRSHSSLVSFVAWTLRVAAAVLFCCLSLVNMNSKVGDSLQLRWSGALWWREVDGAGQHEETWTSRTDSGDPWLVDLTSFKDAAKVHKCLSLPGSMPVVGTVRAQLSQSLRPGTGCIS